MRTKCELLLCDKLIPLTFELLIIGMTTHERNKSLEDCEAGILSGSNQMQKLQSEIQSLWHGIKDFTGSTSYEEAERVGRVIKEKRTEMEILRKQVDKQKLKLAALRQTSESIRLR